ncbi:MAG: regulatory protein RecX [Peptococcaceae bacterium]|nr:regulatory protein RecX [Peptococcaceae bacterium]
MTGGEGAYALGIKLLSLRPRSEWELLRRMEGRFGRDGAAAALGRLKREGYVDDGSFARWWIDQRVTFKPTGSLRLRQELLQHGLDPGLVRDVLGTFTLAAETEAALAAARKKLSSPAGEPDDRRLSLFLARRGFPRAVIDTVLGALRGQDCDFY